MEDTGTVRKALRRLKGRATVGDIVSATGLEQSRAEASLRALLEWHEGHLEVGERGDILYRFDPALIRRDRVPLWTRVKERAWSVFKTGFKLWIVAMLVVYFIVFVALMIAALLANNRDGDGGGLGGGERRGGGHVHFPNFWFWYLIWSPNWGWGRPYYGERYEERRGDRTGRGARKGPPFYKKVFAFVFGPDRPETTPERRDRDHLRFIRSRRGAVSAVDLVQATGLGLHEAESELARLMVAHDGDVEVTEDGTLVYLFPSLMVSAHGKVEVREPPAAWQRLEPKLPVTGNSAGSNAAIVGINAFNIVAAATAPWFIFPRLGIGGTAAEVGLIWIPVIFSVSFFAVPLLRLPSVWRENGRRALRNVRKAVLGLVSKASLAGEEAAPVGLDEAKARVRRGGGGHRLGNSPVPLPRVPKCHAGGEPPAIDAGSRAARVGPDRIRQRRRRCHPGCPGPGVLRSGARDRDRGRWVGRGRHRPGGRAGVPGAPFPPGPRSAPALHG
jgi:uncharacterized RDD family membrane protein YckC